MAKFRAAVDSRLTELLAHTARIDEVLGVVILNYFRPDEPDVFDSLFIEPMPSARRADVVGKIVDRLKLKKEFGPLLTELKELRGGRNKWVHSQHWTQNLAYAEELESVKVILRTRSWPEPSSNEHLATLGDLGDLVERARRAHDRLAKMAVLMAAVHECPRKYFPRPGWDPRSLGKDWDPRGIVS